MADPAVYSEQDSEEGILTSTDIRPVPRIAIQAFYENASVAEELEDVFADRRLSRAKTSLHTGGLAAAIELFLGSPTPNLVIIETTSTHDKLLIDLEQLAEVCDPGTKVVLIGQTNDVQLYRELIRRGISEYIVAPLNLVEVVQLISELYTGRDTDPVGKVISFIGAKGGVGASTIAHNVAWSIARNFNNNVVIADLDLPFGTAGLDFNLDPVQGMGDVIAHPDRVDDVLIDRLLSKCADNLSLLAAPATLDRTYDFEEMVFDPLLEVIQGNVPLTVLDVPHSWNAWTNRVLLASDEIAIVAAPDLGNLRNAKNLIDQLRQMRPNDQKPHLIINQQGVPKRPEIGADDFADAVGIEPVAVIGFDPHLFGQASNNGQMLAEVDPKAGAAAQLETLASIVSGRSEVKKQAKRGLGPILSKLMGKKS
ncbi:AAA family ATPase [Coralliovum pocilloporae]|uniref:AAA family ATPase n=1 Tax=Coralliovum pocilloporae TaxID=3066369 RepID=UPI0033077925